jgi:ABC-type cobalamin transport system permease subunit
MRARSTATRFVLLIPLVLLIIAATTLLGSGWIPWRDLVGESREAYIFWHLRVPPNLLAACARPV